MNLPQALLNVLGVLAFMVPGVAKEANLVRIEALCDEAAPLERRLNQQPPRDFVYIGSNLVFLGYSPIESRMFVEYFGEDAKSGEFGLMPDLKYHGSLGEEAEDTLNKVCRRIQGEKE